MQAMSAAIESDGRASASSADDVARTIAGRELAVLADAVASPGRRLLEDGRILHDQAQPDEAVPVLEQAVTELGQAMTIVDVSRDLWDALLYLGAAHLALGDEEAASRAWAEAAVLTPERQPDSARLPPTVTGRFAAIQTEVAETTGALDIRATDATSLTVDGREIGQDTAQISALPAGKHHIRARGADGRAAYQLVEVAPGRTSKVELALGPPQLGVAAATDFARGRQTADLYRGLAVAGGLDLVLVAGGREGKGFAQLFSPTADRFSAPIQVGYIGALDDELVEIVPELLGALDAEGRLTVAGSGSTAAPLDPSANLLLGQLLLAPKSVAPAAPGRAGRGWIYAAGGATAALLLGGGIAAAALAPDGERGTIIVGPVP